MGRREQRLAAACSRPCLPLPAPASPPACLPDRPPACLQDAPGVPALAEGIPSAEASQLARCEGARVWPGVCCEASLRLSLPLAPRGPGLHSPCLCGLPCV